MTDASKPNTPADHAPVLNENLSFEDALARLEGIAAELESGDLGLTESLKEYEEGVAHLRHCHALLRSAERKIELLTGVDSEGRPVVQSFDDAAGDSLDEKSAARGQRRGVKKTKKRRKKMASSPPNAAPPRDDSREPNSRNTDEPRELF